MMQAARPRPIWSDEFISGESLWLSCLTPAQHARTCGYWFTLQKNCTAWTAFRTRAALEGWAMHRGLEIVGTMPTPGEFASLRLSGEFVARRHASPATLPEGPVFPFLNNAQWWPGRLTTEAGRRVVHSYFSQDPALHLPRQLADRFEAEGMPGGDFRAWLETL